MKNSLSFVLAWVFSLWTAPSAEPKVSLVYGGWQPGEGQTVTAPPNQPLQEPFGLAFDKAGNRWIVELGGGRVHRLDVAGRLETIAGDGSKSYRGDGGPAREATFNGMHNLALTRAGEIYLADTWNHCVRKIDGQTLRISTAIGSGQRGFGGDDGPLAKAEFSDVINICLNAQEDKLYIADIGNRRVRVADLKADRIRTFAGDGQKGVPKEGEPAAQAPLIDPRAVAVDSRGNVYVLERSGNALRVVRPNGKIFTVAGTGQKGRQDGPGSHATFGSPKHLCLDDQDNVIIADEGNHLIRKYSPKSGLVSTLLGHGRVKLRAPHGVTWHQGKLYVVDSGNHRILRSE